MEKVTRITIAAFAMVEATDGGSKKYQLRSEKLEERYTTYT
jgi:hypothetical protein